MNNCVSVKNLPDYRVDKVLIETEFIEQAGFGVKS